MHYTSGSWASFAFAVTVALAACGESNDPKKTAKETAAPQPDKLKHDAIPADADIVPVNCANIIPAATVVLQDMTFSPLLVEIENGDVVRWINRDTAPHTVTSGSPDAGRVGTAFDSGTLKPGQSVCYQFHTVAEFTYFCTIHPDQMRDAVVAVRESGGDDNEDNLDDSGDDWF